VVSDKEWSALAGGREVRFREREGEKGPHASAVTLI
jgi:cold shock CspA family protein